MITAIDTNVLLDILVPNEKFWGCYAEMAYAVKTYLLLLVSSSTGAVAGEHLLRWMKTLE